MTYAAYKCHLRRMQPSVWETAIDVSFFAVDDADISLHPPHHHQVGPVHPDRGGGGVRLRPCPHLQSGSAKICIPRIRIKDGAYAK